MVTCKTLRACIELLRYDSVYLYLYHGVWQDIKQTHETNMHKTSAIDGTLQLSDEVKKDYFV